MGKGSGPISSARDTPTVKNAGNYIQITLIKKFIYTNLKVLKLSHALKIMFSKIWSLILKHY